MSKTLWNNFQESVVAVVISIIIIVERKKETKKQTKCHIQEFVVNNGNKYYFY